VLGISDCGALTGKSGRFGSPLAGLAMSVSHQRSPTNSGDIAWVFSFEKARGSASNADDGPPILLPLLSSMVKDFARWRMLALV
jgi:hypothetical protein